jgi:YD repeat-containing protein
MSALDTARLTVAEIEATSYWATCKSKPTTHLYRAHAAALQTVAQLTPAPVPVPPPVNPYQALTGLCAYAETDLALIAGLGIKHVRCDFSKATASWLTTCRKLGLKVTLIADYAMGLGTNGDHSQPKDYVAWSQKVAARVNGQEDVIEAVEVWNEPWLSSFWSPTPDPAAYLALVRACAAAVWQVAPSMLVLISLDYNANVQVVGQTDHLWRKHILEYDARGFLTDPRIRPSIHCYCQKLAPDQSTSDFQNGFQRYEACYDDLKAHGHPDPQCWVTEYGWESATVGGWGNFLVTEQQQADYTVAGLKLMYHSGKVERSHAYFLQSTNTWSYNLLRPDNTPKPVIQAVKALLA